MSAAPSGAPIESRGGAVQVCPLGKGAFGNVMLVKWNNDFCALKQISKALVVKSQLVNHIKAEKRLMAECDCPFLVRLQAAFQDTTHLYLVMDFVQGGELFTFMRKRRRALREAWARFYAATVICGFAYLSTRDIVYRCASPRSRPAAAPDHRAAARTHARRL